MAEVADQLAVAVGTQWKDEADVRRLNDPYPLPVSWVPADASLTDSWDLLVKVASSGAGWPTPPPAATWAAGPDDLVGAGGDLVEVLAKVPTGRLIVLGEPGAGKTMLMVRLVLDLLARRVGGGPVPILASVASWNPADQDLRDWLAAQLVIDHAALAAPPPAGMQEPTLAAALLASGLILPVLDGLDEIPEKVRGSAISRINDALRPGEHLVVTCRSQQYRDAVRPERGVEVTLRGAAALQLRPLDADAVCDYLCDDAAGPLAMARWDPVLAVLGTKAPAGQALATPLMVGLARAIYNPRPGEMAGRLREPKDLCDPGLTDRKAVESLLFDAFIPAAYRNDSASRWKARDAEKWLVFLACYLARPDLAWWQLPLAIPGFGLWFGVLGGVVGGVVCGALFVGASGPVVALAMATGGVGFGLLVWSWVGRSPKPMGGSQRQGQSDGIAMAATVAGLVAGAAVGVLAVIAIGVMGGIGTGVGTAVLAGSLGVWSVGQESASFDISSATSPWAALARDRRTAIIVGITTGLLVGIGLGGFTTAGAAVWVASNHHVTGFEALSIAVLVIVAMVAAGVTASFEAAWPSYAIARIWLALRNRLPWRLMGFLADAHKRGVLRQAGAVYQFRHIELQHRLAIRSEPVGVAVEEKTELPAESKAAQSGEEATEGGGS
jgi:hypothetical protein